MCVQSYFLPPRVFLRRQSRKTCSTNVTSVVRNGIEDTLLDEERGGQRHTVEEIADPVPVVPMLFMVEPQKVEQLVDMLSPLDFRVAEQVFDVPEQVFDVPTVVCPPRAARTVLCAPQLAEQLVEVPSPVSFSSLLQRSMEQNV